MFLTRATLRQFLFSQIKPQRIGTSCSGCVKRNYTSDNNQKTTKKLRPVTLVSPFMAMKNFLWGVMVRGYFQPSFQLKEFMEACPHAMAQLINVLQDNDKDALDDLMTLECKQTLLRKWNLLDSEQTEQVKAMTAENFTFIAPKILMRMNDKDSEDKIPAFLNITMLMVVNIHAPSWKDYLPVGYEEKKVGFRMFEPPYVTKLLDNRCFVSFFTTFEREITKGTEENWKILNLGSWPIPA